MLTKSAFIEFLHCQKSFWLKAKRPNAITWPSPSAHDRMLMRDGYAVEREADRLIAVRPDASQFRKQVVFETDLLSARADLVFDRDDGAIEILEIKGSTSIKKTTDRDYITDAAFQVHVARQAGLSVVAVHIMHLNPDYVRIGEIDPASLLMTVDVTSDVEERLVSIVAEIDEAVTLLALEELDKAGCSCVQFGNADRRCPSFEYFNPGVPEHSIYLLPRLSQQKAIQFHSEGRLALVQIEPSELTPGQLPVHRAALEAQAVINIDSIRQFLGNLQWPLHFYDYETFGSAIPIADGHSPHQQMPVQLSLHILEVDGRLEHFEWLTMQPGEQRQLVDQLEASVGPVGSVVSWNMTFEKACNTRMAKLLPEKSAFLLGLNERTVDLMEPFKADYVDIRFKGSTSIKNVLPVLCPGLSYDQDAVHDGAGAMEAWQAMIETHDPEERSRLSAELLAYCKLDTLAMVEIYRVLKQLCDNSVARPH